MANIEKKDKNQLVLLSGLYFLIILTAIVILCYGLSQTLRELSYELLGDTDANFFSSSRKFFQMVRQILVYPKIVLFLCLGLSLCLCYFKTKSRYLLQMAVILFFIVIVDIVKLIYFFANYGAEQFKPMYDSWVENNSSWNIFFYLTNLGHGILYFFLLQSFIMYLGTIQIFEKKKTVFILSIFFLGIGTFSTLLGFNLALSGFLQIIYACGMLILGITFLKEITTKSSNTATTNTLLYVKIYLIHKIELGFRTFLIYQLVIPIIDLIVFLIFKEFILASLIANYIIPTNISSVVLLYVLFDVFIFLVFLIIPLIHWIVFYQFEHHNKNANALCLLIAFIIFFGGIIYLPSLLLAHYMYKRSNPSHT